MSKNEAAYPNPKNSQFLLQIMIVLLQINFKKSTIEVPESWCKKK
jgi:hypothetical protein